MDQRVDMKRLKQDIKDTTVACRAARLARQAAERALSLRRHDKDYGWKAARLLCDAINKARAEVMSHSWAMTGLCVFRAHLRGRAHLGAASSLLDQVDGWLRQGYERYGVLDTKAAG